MGSRGSTRAQTHPSLLGLSDLPREGVEAAIEELAAEGVVRIADDETVQASLCARRPTS